VLRCPGRLLPMAGLGVVIVACVLSVQRVVEVSDGQNGHSVMVQHLPGLDTNNPRGEVLQLWQEEALGAGRDGQTFTVRSYRSSCSILPVLGGSLADGWMVHRCDVQGLGILNDPAFLDDSRLLRARADVARSLALRVASERVVMAEVTQVAVDEGGLGFASPMDEEAIDASLNRRDTETGSTGELWLISHYTAGANFGGSSYPFGSPTASGIPAQPGVVACGSSYLGEAITIAGWDMLCADTGNPYYVYDGVADIWCQETPGFWGPTDPQYANEWWYGLPCPAPCEWQDETGRCFAQATVINDADRP